MSFSWAKAYEPKTSLGRWIDDRLPLPRLVYGAIGGASSVCRISIRRCECGWAARAF